MAQMCEVCGKRSQVGNQVVTRGKPKYLGGVGTKIRGITRRRFRPNLQRVRVTQNGTNKTMRVCTRCIRSGAITKLVRAKPFRLPADAATVNSGEATPAPKARKGKKDAADGR
jgi:large subunit ribosomal protein L28